MIWAPDDMGTELHTFGDFRLSTRKAFVTLVVGK
jgi:hypothetical protein